MAHHHTKWWLSSIRSSLQCLSESRAPRVQARWSLQKTTPWRWRLLGNAAARIAHSVPTALWQQLIAMTTRESRHHWRDWPIRSTGMQDWRVWVCRTGEYRYAGLGSTGMQDWGVRVCRTGEYRYAGLGSTDVLVCRTGEYRCTGM